MRFLLDTHALIWYSDSSGKLSNRAEELIDNPENTVFISSVSLWEIAIKIKLRRIGISFNKLLDEVEKADFTVLHAENTYLKELIDLPLIHKDPFDRLLIATAKSEDMTLITADDDIHKYDVKWVW